MRKLCLAFTAISMATAAVAQELPSENELLSRINLPGYWEVTSFRLVAQAMVGTPIDPRAQLRFEIDASPVADLFVPSGEGTLGPFTTLIASVPDAATRTIYGTMDLQYSAGNWDGPVVVENPVDALSNQKTHF